MEQLNKIDPADVITREQYNDFLMGRTFRQTLLCRKEISLHQLRPSERLYGLRFAGDLRPASAAPDLRSEAAELFKGPAGAEIETNRPPVKAALALLGAVWPQSIAFDDLINSVQKELGKEGSAAQEDTRRQLAEALLQAHLAGHIEIHAHRAPLAATIGERPTASALARLQLRKGLALSTLRHQSIHVEGALSRHLVLLLDGTRDRSALLSDLASLVKSGAAAVVVNGATIDDLDSALAQLSDGLEKHLIELARLGLLIA
jgi:methyltransferase-like protein